MLFDFCLIKLYYFGGKDMDLFSNKKIFREKNEKNFLPDGFLKEK